MTPFLLKYIRHPVTGEKLKLDSPVYEGERVVSGTLVGKKGECFPIINGIPRFLDVELQQSVAAFGDEWNYFNYLDFKPQWLAHVVKHTFGSMEAFKNKVIVDCGGGSGAQSLWFLEGGAEHVIMLELSHSVDDVIQRNVPLEKWKNFDVIQCSMDAPPLAKESIRGIVYCHNVIQHTPSVEKTARALYRIVAPGGEFVFNCYQKNDRGFLRWVRFYFIYKPLRAVLSRMPFWFILAYARVMGVLREIPLIGMLCEKSYFCVQGNVPPVEGETRWQHLKRRYRSTVLNTFDGYGSHTYQHHKSNDEIRLLIQELQPDASKIKNTEPYFTEPMPIGCALRVFK
jgi:ubiquinone/menaquinone biosynthesis C-methylase UbiE